MTVTTNDAATLILWIAFAATLVLITWRASIAKVAKRVDLAAVDVGRVYSFEYEGYCYYAIVRGVFERRGVLLVAYQSWRDNQEPPTDPSRWVEHMAIPRFLALYSQQTTPAPPQASL